MKLLIVVPALNEESSLPPLIAAIRQATAGLAWQVDIAVIDDGSTDRTAGVALAAGARVLRLCRNLGIGGAVQAGLRLAFREGFDLAAQLDGDGQHPPAELEKLLEGLSATVAPDLVVGTRYAANGGYRSTALRRLGSRWLRLVLWAVTGQRVTDPTSGFRLYGRRALELFAQTYPYDYPEPEALALACAHGLRVVEVPVTMRERQAGRSSIAGLYAPYYMLKVTLAVVLSYVRSVKRARRLGESE